MSPTLLAPRWTPGWCLSVPNDTPLHADFDPEAGEPALTYDGARHSPADTDRLAARLAADPMRDDTCA